MNHLSQNTNTRREKLIWAALSPQFVLLVISIIWINIFPEDNVFKYLKLDLLILLKGIGVGIALALAGYLFYIITKKTKTLSATAELFETMLAPTFSVLKPMDMIALSIIAGFCEEIFFRGLLLPKIGLLISSIAFGVLHLPGFRFWIYAVWATLSGVLFGGLFLITHSLWLPITAHAVNNIVGMFLLKKLQPK